MAVYLGENQVSMTGGYSSKYDWVGLHYNENTSIYPPAREYYYTDDNGQEKYVLTMTPLAAISAANVVLRPSDNKIIFYVKAGSNAIAQIYIPLFSGRTLTNGSYMQYTQQEVNVQSSSGGMIYGDGTWIPAS